MPVFSALLFALAPAFAGDVVVSSTVSADIQVHGTSIARLSTAGSLTLSDMDPGTYTFVVVRSTGEKVSVPIRVPALGSATLDIGVATATTDSPGDAEVVAAGPPTVAIRGAAGQRFAVLVDGARRSVLAADQVLQLDDLGPGEHLVQFRSSDYQTIWVRGALILQAGDQVELFVEEGRMVTASGRAGAWKPR
jgi:hypothetical protein